MLKMMFLDKISVVFIVFLFIANACSSPPDEMHCQTITDLEVCEADPECGTFRARRIRVEDLTRGEDSCNEQLADEDTPLLEDEVHFCTSKHLSYSPAYMVYARQDDESGDWNIFQIPNDPDNIEAAGLSRCTAIPESEANDLGYWCQECMQGSQFFDE